MRLSISNDGSQVHIINDDHELVCNLPAGIVMEMMIGYKAIDEGRSVVSREGREEIIECLKSGSYFHALRAYRFDTDGTLKEAFAYVDTLVPKYYVKKSAEARDV